MKNNWLSGIMNVPCSWQTAGYDAPQYRYMASFRRSGWLDQGKMDDDRGFLVRKGLFETEIDGDYVEKAFPQEQGNHTGTEFLRIGDDCGGFLFTSDENTQFQFRATHHSIEAINAARHYCELKNRDTSYLRVDYKVSGVGSHSSKEKYKFLEKDFGFRFYMKPFTK